MEIVEECGVQYGGNMESIGPPLLLVITPPVTLQRTEEGNTRLWAVYFYIHQHVKRRRFSQDRLTVCAVYTDYMKILINQVFNKSGI